MKRILFVHQVSEVGGASYCLLSLLKEIDRYKYEPIVLLKKEGPLVEELKMLNIQVIFMSSLYTIPYNQSFVRLQTSVTYCKVLFSRKYFAEILRLIKPDILYLNNSMLYPYLRVGKALGIRTIIHIREHWPMNDHHIQLSCFQRNIRNYSDQIIVINEYCARMIPMAEEKISIVYDWIDFSNRDKKYDLNELLGEDVTNKKLFLYTGGMQSIKGALEIFEGFSRVCGSDSRLLALGCNENIELGDWRGIIKKILSLVGYKVGSFKIVEALRKDKRIISLPATYAIKDIIEKSYCMLSFFTIPHANLALAECIILKTPVIAARTPESEEYSEGGKYAELFDFKDKNQFEQKLAEIDILRPSLKARIEKGHNIIAEKFDRKRNSDTFRSVLDSMI